MGGEAAKDQAEEVGGCAKKGKSGRRPCDGRSLRGGRRGGNCKDAGGMGKSCLLVRGGMNQKKKKKKTSWGGAKETEVCF